MYYINKYGIGDSDEDIEMETKSTTSIQYALKVWISMWCDSPFMCEITSSEEEIKSLLDWVYHHPQEFNDIGNNTSSVKERVIFNSAYDDMIENVKESYFCNYKGIISLADNQYTAMPFCMG